LIALVESREGSRNDREVDHGEEGEEGKEGEKGKEDEEGGCGEEDRKEICQEVGKENRRKACSREEGQGSGQEGQGSGQEGGCQEIRAQEICAQEGSPEDSGPEADDRGTRAQAGNACGAPAAQAGRYCAARAAPGRSASAAPARSCRTVAGAGGAAASGRARAEPYRPDGAASDDTTVADHAHAADTRAEHPHPAASRLAGPGGAIVAELDAADAWAWLDQLERLLASPARAAADGRALAADYPSRRPRIKNAGPLGSPRQDNCRRFDVVRLVFVRQMIVPRSWRCAESAPGEAPQSNRP
jgi:hypothetical protein